MRPDPVSQALQLTVGQAVRLEVFEMFVVALPVRRSGVYVLSIVIKYQGVKEFHMLARIGCCNFMVFSPFKVNVTYYHPLNQWLLGATNDNQGQTVMHNQCSETINHI